MNIAYVIMEFTLKIILKILIDLNIYHLTYIRGLISTFFSVLSSFKEAGIPKESLVLGMWFHSIFILRSCENYSSTIYSALGVMPKPSNV